MRGVVLKCGQGDCVRCYLSFNSLSRHLRDQHPNPHTSIDYSFERENDAGVVSTTSGELGSRCAELEYSRNIELERYD